MKRLFLIRHAESMNNVWARRIGKEPLLNAEEIRQKTESDRESDPSLSEKGLAQAKSLCSKLKKVLNPMETLLISSPMRRALLTAREIADELGIPAVRFLCHGKLYEVGGCYYEHVAIPSATPREIRAEFQVTNIYMPEKGWFSGFTQRETDAQAESRVEEMASWIKSTLSKEWSKFETLVLVAHGDFLNRLLRFWLGTPRCKPIAFVHGNTGITTIKWSDSEGMLLLSLNDESHLPSRLRSPIGQDWWKETVPGLVIDRYAGMEGIPKSVREDTLNLRRRHLFFPDGKTIEDYEESDARNTHFVLYSSGALCGYVQYDPKLNRLRQLVVEEAFRGKGLAQLLVLKVKAEARSQGAKELVVHAWQQSASFYRRVGFNPRGELKRDSKTPWLFMTAKL